MDMIITEVSERITDVLQQLLPWWITLIPIYLAVRGVWLVCRRRRGFDISWLREAGMLLLCVYIIGMLTVTVLPEVYIGSDTVNLYYPGGKIGEEGNCSGDYLNLLPGNMLITIIRSFQDFQGMSLWWSCFANIALFIPFGALICCLYNWKISNGILFGAGVSLGIELFQLLLPRATDIDDLLLNTFGMLIGYLIGMLCKSKGSAKIE